MQIRIKRNTFPRLIIILIYSFLFIYRFRGERYDFFQLRYIVSAAIIAVALFVFLVSKNKKKFNVEARLTLRFMAPYFAIIVWTLLQVIIVNAKFGLAFTQFYRILLITGISFALFVLFGDDAKNMLFSSMIITYTVTLISGIMTVGLDGFFTYLVSPTQKDVKDTLARYFEVHDLTFALGIFLLYFILFINHKKRADYLKIIICIAYIYFGYKRVELIAIGLTYLLFLFLRKRQIQFKLKFAAIALMAVVIGFIVISGTDILSQITSAFHINTEGRLDFYSQMRSVMNLTPFFFGHGYGFVSDYIKTFQFGALGTVTMTRMHNDLLALYIELGCVPFLAWLFYYVYAQTTYFAKKFGQNNGLLYFVLMMYLVITYATDNTSTYFMSQAAFCTILITECRAYSMSRNEVKE